MKTKIYGGISRWFLWLIILGMKFSSLCLSVFSNFYYIYSIGCVIEMLSLKCKSEVTAISSEIFWSTIWRIKVTISMKTTNKTVLLGCINNNKALVGVGGRGVS